MPMNTSGGGGGGGGIFSGIQSSIAQKIAGMGKPEESKFMSEQELNIKRQREELKEQDRMMKERMRQNATQMPLRTPAPEQNFTNAKATFNPTQFTPGGPPNLLIPNNDPRPTITSNQTVKDVLERLHNRAADTQDTQDETTTNNDRLLSDTTASESKKKGGRKKKPLMQI